VPIRRADNTAYEAIERARVALAASAELDRTEASLNREDARAAREQAGIDMSVAQTERDLARQPPGRSE
jgi:hypothetical protein